MRRLIYFKNVINETYFFAKDFVLDLLFPIRCLGCGGELENLKPKERWICPECLVKIETRKEQVCPVCEEFSEGGKTHHKCENKTSLDGLWVATEYDCEIVSEAIHKLKFNFVKDISFPLSRIMEKSILGVEEFGDFQDVVLANRSKESEEEVYLGKNKNKKAETIIIPVPLHKKRQNWRGFNQAFLLSFCIAEKFDLIVCDDFLFRTKNTKPQTKIKSMEEREENIKGAFSCLNKNFAERKNVILTDDVCTTMATLDECAKELKKAGAESVWGLVVARR